MADTMGRQERSLGRAGSFAVGLALVGAVSLIGCEGSGSGGGEGTNPIRFADAEIARAQLGAAADSTLVIDSPANYEKVAYTGIGTSVSVEVTVEGGPVGSGPDDLRIRYFENGELVGEKTTADPFLFEALPKGQHHLAARLVTETGQILPNAGSLDDVYVRVVGACTTASDCSDAQICSGESCQSGECRYGDAGGANCCDSALECPYGWLCVGDSCQECLSATHCDDGDSCTNDSCVGGSCLHEQIEGCCNEVNTAGCDDGNACTLEGCDLATETCTHAPVDDPLCCNVQSDCQPEDPCVAYICYKSAGLEYPRCRFGPSQLYCCDQDDDCTDNNPCTLDSCQYADPADDAGTCAFQPDPAQPSCCITDADCDDADPATLDVCDAGACTHEEDEAYCALPPTSSVVIHEFLPHPGAVDDVEGEWIELYNASSETVSVEGWTLLTSVGEVHEITAAQALSVSSLSLPPGGILVLGRTADATLNGGTKAVRYVYGNAISLPDAMETNGDVVHTLTLEDADGAVVDEVTYRHCLPAFCEDQDGDPATDDMACGNGDPCTTHEDCNSGFCTDQDPSWPILPKRSMELRNPHRDNDLMESWSSSGVNANPANNISYGGTGQNEIFASPGIMNESAFQDIQVEPAACPPPQGLDDPCVAAYCGLDSRCSYQRIFGCCLDDSECDASNYTYNVCEQSTCDFDEVQGVGSCTEATTLPGCCTRNTDCDDDNVCNLDRCIGNVCRFSPDLIEDCCETNADCEDGDACTINSCDAQSHSCNAPEPVTTQGGGTCCNTDADCDDDDPATLNVCDPDENICKYPDDPDYCTTAGAPCDDGKFCTLDSCDVATSTCLHEHNPECCAGDEECEDGNVCTVDSCDPVTGDCVNDMQDGCCIEHADCDDQDGCTVDSCDTASNVCHHTPQNTCCNTHADCGPAKYCVLTDCLGHAGTCKSSPAGGLACCVTDADCDDGKAYTLDVCLASTKQCDFSKNPDWCLADSDCNDGVVCTIDTCNPGTGQCTNSVDETCCSSDADCAPDAYACTDEVCDALTGECGSVAVPDCCETIGPNAECDDGDLCTDDICDLDHVCRPSEIPGCCEFDWQCADELECTNDWCEIPPEGGAGECMNVNPDPFGCCCPDGFECNADGICENDLQVALSGGEAWVGCDLADDPECTPHEAPYHQVILKSYAIDKTEVTAAMYKECVQAGICDPPEVTDSYYATYDDPAKQDHPANYVSWSQARTYCEEWRDSRLCYEAEWERAARGGCELYGDCEAETPKYPWGDTPAVDCSLAVMLGVGGAFGCGTDQTWPVGTRPNGDSPYGIQDMVGNVQEWVWDYYAPYGLGTATYPKGPIVGEKRMWKGGSLTQEAKLQRPASRWSYSNPTVTADFGFRCCMRTAALLPVDAAASEVWVAPPGTDALTGNAMSIAQQADDTSFVYVRIFVKDVEGQPLPGMFVNIDITGEGQTIEPQTPRTDLQGFLQAKVRSTHVDLKTVTVSVSGAGEDSPVELEPNPTIDFQACGDLGTGCPPGWACSGGTCRDPSGEKVYVPHGPFWMGCDPGDPHCNEVDAPKHRVVLDAFQVLRREVTTWDYQQCVSQGHCTPPDVECVDRPLCPAGMDVHTCRDRCSYAPYVNYDVSWSSGAAIVQHPINYLTWNDARQVCAWKGMRLCTEAEWEKTARGGCDVHGDCQVTTPPYPWGTASPSCTYANYQGCDGSRTTRTGAKAAGTSPYGAVEMAGNVFEWVADFYQQDYYAVSSEENPSGPAAGTDRVMRGGAFNHGACFSAGYVRAAAAPWTVSPALGARCCADSGWWTKQIPWIDFP